MKKSMAKITIGITCLVLIMAFIYKGLSSLNLKSPTPSKIKPTIIRFKEDSFQTQFFINNDRHQLFLLPYKLPQLYHDPKAFMTTNENKEKNPTKRSIIKSNADKKPTPEVINNPDGELWIASIQEEDGHWDSSRWDGGGSHDEDLITTAYALLTFLGSGHTNRVGKYKKTVKKGFKWLLENQFKDGSFSTDNYVNAVCSQTLFEGIGMGIHMRTIGLENYEIKALDYILELQNKSGGFSQFGTSEILAPSYHDNMQSTLWNTLALKSAYASEIQEKESKKALDKVVGLLNKAEYTKDNTSTSKGYAWDDADSNAPARRNGSNAQAQALVIRLYGGSSIREPWCEAAADDLLNHLPKTYNDIDHERILMSSYSLFQMGGIRWKKWRKNSLRITIPHQIKEGELKGSWPPVYNNNSYNNRVIFTAIIINSQTYYYCYKSIIE